VFVGAYAGLRIGELAGLRPSRVDLLAGAVTVAEILTEVKATNRALRHEAWGGVLLTAT
jgi:integrase